MIQNQLLLSRARSAALSRDFDLAARLYRQILRDDRNNVDVLKQLGNIYNIDGTLVGNSAKYGSGLRKGVYIQSGKKVVVK